MTDTKVLTVEEIAEIKRLDDLDKKRWAIPAGVSEAEFVDLRNLHDKWSTVDIIPLLIYTVVEARAEVERWKGEYMSADLDGKNVRQERDEARSEAARYRAALEKLRLGWLYWPTANQPDPRVLRYDSKSLNQIEEMAKEALSSPSPALEAIRGVQKTLKKGAIWCTCPDGRALLPAPKHVADCSFFLRHEALEILTETFGGERDG